MNKESDDENKPDQYIVDIENDEAVRSICVVHSGKSLDPYQPPPPPVVEAKEEVVEVVLDPKDVTWSEAKTATMLSVGAVGLGANIPNAPMLSKC